MSQQQRVYDELLVLLAREGDRRAGERLAARWRPRLLRTARRLLRDADLAEDAVQEAWAGVWKGLRKLNDPSRFPAWAFGVLHRKCADRIRLAERLRARETELDAAPTPATRTDERALAIRQAFEQLDETVRPTALLYYGEGLTVAEIALATGVPAGTVKSRLFAARLKLKSLLKGDDDDEV